MGSANTEQIKGLKYQKWRTKQMILDLDPKQKKKRGADWFELDEELDEAWILEHQAFLVQEQRSKIEKKFEKENEKLVVDGEKELKAKELAERLEVADELEKKFKRENKTKKVEAEGKGPTVEKFEAAIKKFDDRIATMVLQAEDREGNKEVALGTSKIVGLPFSCAKMTILTDLTRTTLILDLRSSSLRSLTCQSRSSSQRPSGKSSTGLSSPLKTPITGSFNFHGQLFSDHSLVPKYQDFHVWRGGITIMGW